MNPPSNRSPRRAAPWWAVLLLAALAMVAWDSVPRIGRSLHLSQSFGVAVHAPPEDPDSPTGYRDSVRSLILPVAAPDAQHWIMQTQQMRWSGGWRVRSVDYDNSPDGRAVHWGSPWRWWLVALAHIDHAITGTALPIAVERTALWAGPALLALIFAVFIPFAARHAGGCAAALLAAGMIGTSAFSVQFVAGNADHHGLVTACAMAMVGCLVAAPRGARAGDVRPVRGDARWWFAGSGVFGAIGMWVSAASLVPVLIGVGLGAVAAMYWSRSRAQEGGAAFDPTLWRLWGIAGGSASLLAYAIEYVAADFAWRLEVNHPAYAIAWLAAGELLCRLGRVCGGVRPAWKAVEVAVWIAAGAGVLIVPVLILTLGAMVFLPADAFLAALHSDYIAEFGSMAGLLARRGLDLPTISCLMPLMALGLACLLFARRKLAGEQKATLALAAGPAVVMICITVFQVRWWGLASGLTFVVLAVACSLLDRTDLPARAKRAWRVAGLILLSPGLLGAAHAAWRAGIPIEDDVLRLAERDVAHRLRLRTGSEPLVIAATPDKTTSLIYHSGARGLGTLYWENIDGLKTAAALFGAPTMDAAREIIARAGVTHMVLFSWDATDAMCVRLDRGLAPEYPLPANAFALALKEGRLPAWLRPIPHRLPSHPLLREQGVLVFEVTNDRPPEAVAVHSATYFVESGDAANAQRLEATLAGFPESPATTATLAGLQARRRDVAAFEATMARLTLLLPHVATLPLEDRVRVAMVLAIGGQEKTAASVMRAALEHADERALRKLTPGTMTDLATLGEVLGVEFPDPALRALAAELTPPK